MRNIFSGFNGSQTMAVITVMTTLIVPLFGISLALKNNIDIGIPMPNRNAIVITKDSEIFKSINMIDSYRNETLELKNTLNNIKNSAALSPDSVRIEELESKLKILQNKIETINSVIIASPEKSLAVPMMRKDIDSIDKSMKVLSNYTENQFQRFYNLFLWICGTIFLGIAGLGVSLFLSNKSSS